MGRWKYVLLGMLAVVALAVAGFAVLRPMDAKPAAETSAPTFKPSPQPTRVFLPAVGFLGDSYTAGDGATSQAARWTTLLAGKRNWVETNAGFGGTGYGTAGRLPGGTPYAERVAKATAGVSDAEKPIIIVSGGRNDLAEKTPSADIQRGITKTFADLRAAAPKARIIALSPLWDDAQAPAGLADIGEEVSMAVAAVGGVYVDLGQPLYNHPEFIGPDGVHPNDAGYAHLAEAINAALPKDLP